MANRERISDEEASGFLHFVRSAERLRNLKQALTEIRGKGRTVLPGLVGKDATELLRDVSPYAEKLTPPLFPDDIAKLDFRLKNGQPFGIGLLNCYYRLHQKKSRQERDKRTADEILYHLGDLHTHRQIATALYALAQKGMFERFGYHQTKKRYRLVAHLRVIEWLHFFTKANIHLDEKRINPSYIFSLLMADGLIDRDFITYWVNNYKSSWCMTLGTWKDHHAGNYAKFPGPFDARDPLYHVGPAMLW
ncbi:MAG: hypothetical protein AAF355_11115 [Myxococcota bacterium]